MPESLEFYNSLREFVRWLEKNGDPTLPYSSLTKFRRHSQVGQRTKSGALDRYLGKFLEVDHLVEKRFLWELHSANLDPDDWDAKVVPKNKKYASFLNKFRKKPFPYVHSVKTSWLKKLIPHGLEGNFTVQDIWDAHAWTFKKLGIEKELDNLKIYFRNAGVKFRIPSRFPGSKKTWKKKAAFKLEPKAAKRAPVGKRNKAPELKPTRYKDPRTVAAKGTESRVSPGPPRVPAGTEARGKGRTARPLVMQGSTAGPRVHVSRYRILTRFGINIVVGALVELAVTSLLRKIFGDPNEKAYKQLMSEIEPVIQSRMITELEAPRNIQRFEAAPFNQFWFETKIHLVWQINSAGIANVEVSRSLEDIKLKSVRIVGTPGSTGNRSLGRKKLFSQFQTTIYEEIEEYIEYRPIFEELTHGQLLAARGYSLSKSLTVSHGVTKAERLSVIKDYILFAKAYPELRDLHDEAWRDFKDELCMAGVKEFFTEAELEDCRWLRHMKELEQERQIEDRGLYYRLQ